jgi:plasmid stabilization system protein ParE
MARVIVSPQAEQDLAEIVDEISNRAGSVIADNLFDRIVAIIDKLSIVPNASGRLVPALGRDIRCHPIGSYQRLSAL